MSFLFCHFLKTVLYSYVTLVVGDGQTGNLPQPLGIVGRVSIRGSASLGVDFQLGSDANSEYAR